MNIANRLGEHWQRFREHWLSRPHLMIVLFFIYTFLLSAHPFIISTWRRISFFLFKLSKLWLDFFFLFFSCFCLGSVSHNGLWQIASQSFVKTTKSSKITFFLSTSLSLSLSFLLFLSRSQTKKFSLRNTYCTFSKSPNGLPRVK